MQIILLNSNKIVKDKHFKNANKNEWSLSISTPQSFIISNYQLELNKLKINLNVFAFKTNIYLN